VETEQTGRKRFEEVIVVDLFKSYLFKRLDDRQLKRVTGIAEEMAMCEGQKIFTEGERDGRVYILKEGEVEMMTRVEETMNLPISLFREPGDLFGVSALVSPHQYSLSCRCTKPGSLLYIERERLEELNREDPDLGCKLSGNLAAYFLDRLKETRNQLKIHFKTILMSTRS
jgi:CRP-like cAMP-binding protein